MAAATQEGEPSSTAELLAYLPKVEHGAAFTGPSTFSADTVDIGNTCHEESNEPPPYCPETIPDPSGQAELTFDADKRAYFSSDGVRFNVIKACVQEHFDCDSVLYASGLDQLMMSVPGETDIYQHPWRETKAQLVEGALVDPESGNVLYDWCVDVKHLIAPDMEEYECIVFAVSPEGAVSVTDSLNALTEFALHAFRDKCAAQWPGRETWLVPSLGAELAARGNAIVDAVVDAKPADYHPGSDGIVNDVLHPSLYPHITDEPSTLGQFENISDNPIVNSGGLDEKCDVWGRPYEGSIYQWLPSDWDVSAAGSVTLASGSHLNAPPVCDALRPLLEAVYTAAVPLLDALLQFTNENTGGQEGPRPEATSVKGSTLQIVPKVVEFELQPGQSYSGVWHYEAMSHENIVGTVLYVLRRDEGLEGGDLEFQRAFFDDEAEEVMYEVYQNPPGALFEHMEQLAPLGQTELPQGTLLVFPNCHAHRVLPLTNTTDRVLRRRIVVGFLVNPAVPIPSAASVPNLSSSVPLAEAVKNREALMEERRLHKQSMNQREVNLCEH